MDTYLIEVYTTYILYSLYIVGYSRRYCREYPTGNSELEIPDIGYSCCWLFQTYSIVTQPKNFMLD